MLRKGLGLTLYLSPTSFVLSYGLNSFIYVLLNVVILNVVFLGVAPVLFCFNINKFQMFLTFILFFDLSFSTSLLPSHVVNVLPIAICELDVEQGYHYK